MRQTKTGVSADLQVTVTWLGLDRRGGNGFWLIGTSQEARNGAKTYAHIENVTTNKLIEILPPDTSFFSI